ncbi:MAG: molybdenum cofactor biosynthesis protein MoaE [Acidobacteriota bacterium]
MSHLTETPFEPAELLAAVRRDGDGGLALFVGVVRDHNGGKRVTRLEYSAYIPMADKEMDRISAGIEQAHPGARVAFRHRIGSLAIGDVAVAVAAAAPHREEAFAACRAGIEAIKARVPIWKKEFGPDGSSWVEPCGDPSHAPSGNPDSA